MAEQKKKCRQYSLEYLKYGFIPSPANETLPMCLICQKILTNESMKPSRLMDHLKKLHPDRADKDIAYFRSLREKLSKQQLRNVVSSASRAEVDGLRASYNISLMIAKSGKAHTIGEELLLPVISEVLNTVLHRPSSDIIRKIPLSNDTVQRRIDEMARDVEEELCGFLRETLFSLQLDESTLPGNEALLLAYVRFIKNEKLVQELLFARELSTDTRGESAFLVLREFLAEKNIPLKNIISVATDGAPSMTGSQRGFIAYLREAIPGVLAVHCVIHRQHLVAKRLSVRLNCSLQYVINAINKIKSRPLNDRIFRQLCEHNDEDYNRLLLHTEVRWLSKGECLTRFYSLFDTVVEFLEVHDGPLCENLKRCQGDIAYLCDLYAKFNEMNHLLQGDDVNLIKTKAVICSFQSKLLLFRRNFARGELSQFPNLSEMKNRQKIHDEDVEAFCHHLDLLCQDFAERFEDILGMEVPNWVLDPLSAADNAELSLQEEIIELQMNDELKLKLKSGYQAFWLQAAIADLYPGLWSVVRKLLIAFPSSYLVERGFSIVTDLLSKKRNRLQIAKRGDLRLRLTSMKPNVNKLVSLRQSQPSH